MDGARHPEAMRGALRLSATHAGRRGRGATFCHRHRRRGDGRGVSQQAYVQSRVTEPPPPHRQTLRRANEESKRAHGRTAALADANAQLSESLAAAQRARRETEAASRLKDEFLMTVSHELRTPLTAIRGWARMLSTGEIREEQKRHAVETIERNAQAQTQLVDDLLDVSRAISGKLRLDVGIVDLPAVVDAAVESIRPAAAAKEIRLQTIVDPGAGPVSGDAARLQQVVWNLLANAVKFTPRGGQVQVHLQRVNSHVEIVVSDTGAGISGEFLPHVFERFRQEDAGSTRSHGGLGLGLAIVRHLIELHGGTAAAESGGAGMGAISSAAAADGWPGEPASPILGTPPPRRARALNDVHILVVDDEPQASMFAISARRRRVGRRRQIGAGAGPSRRIRPTCCSTSRCRPKTTTRWCRRRAR
jgi:signal transduction histidine kinase